MYSLSYVVFFCPFLLQTLYIVYIRKRRKKERSGNKTEYLFVVVYYLRMIFPRSLEVTEQRSTKVAIAKQ